MIDSLLKTLGERFSLSEQPTGEFGALKANGMKFTVRAFEAKGLGHVSVMQAKGFFGLMKMDTLIVNPLEKDLPLYSYDRIRMMSRDVLITELYDTLLAPRSFETLEAVKTDYREFPDPDVEAHWYDSIKLKESFRKAGQKKVSARFDELTGRFFTAYLDAAPDEPCDAAAKREKASVYVEGLLRKGGPSTDAFLKAIGREKTEQLFRTVLFRTANI